MMDKYARLMQKLEIVNVELFKVSYVISIIVKYTILSIASGNLGDDLVFVLMDTRVCVVYCFFAVVCLFKQRPKVLFQDFVSPRCNVLKLIKLPLLKNHKWDKFVEYCLITLDNFFRVSPNYLASFITTYMRHLETKTRVKAAGLCLIINHVRI